MDISKIRSDFQVFNDNPKLCYLDSAAMALKPKPVKKKSSKLIKSLIEIVSTAFIAAAMLYVMLAITAWCIS